MAKQPRANNRDPKGVALQVEGDEAMRQAARAHANMVIGMLAEVAQSGRNDMARVSAGKELLDRGFGKNHLMVQQEQAPGTEIQVVFGDPAGLRTRHKVIEATVQGVNGQEQP
jgi:hypothetical protein